MLTYGWKQRRRSLRCDAMKNHALQQRRGAGTVPLSPSWQVCSGTWQLSISMINAVVPGLPVAKLKSALLPAAKVKWKRAQCHKFTQGKQMTGKKKAYLKTLTPQNVGMNVCNVKVEIGSQLVLVLFWIVLVNEGLNRFISAHVQIDFLVSMCSGRLKPVQRRHLLLWKKKIVCQNLKASNAKTFQPLIFGNYISQNK